MENRERYLKKTGKHTLVGNNNYGVPQVILGQLLLITYINLPSYFSRQIFYFTLLPDDATALLKCNTVQTLLKDVKITIE